MDVGVNTVDIRGGKIPLKESIKLEDIDIRTTRFSISCISKKHIEEYRTVTGLGDEEAKAKLEKYFNQKTLDLLIFRVADKESGKVVASVELNADLSYYYPEYEAFVKKDYRGNSVGFEALMAVHLWCEKSLDLKSICYRCAVNNTPSLKLFKKLSEVFDSSYIDNTVSSSDGLFVKAHVFALYFSTIKKEDAS